MSVGRSVLKCSLGQRCLERDFGHTGQGSAHRASRFGGLSVLQEGRLVFEGVQSQLETSKDPYISKFVKQRG